MGKYIRKAKMPAETAVMEVLQSSLGVRTRAKTLALQRLPKSEAQPAAQIITSGSYLQLRNRWLLKSPVLLPSHDPGRQRQAQSLIAKKEGNSDENPKPELSSGSDPGGNSRVRVSSVSVEAASSHACLEKGGESAKDEASGRMNENFQGDNDHNNDTGVLGVVASFGESTFDFETRHSCIRESTPPNLIRNPDAISTPGSTTRRTRTSEANRRLRHMPVPHEMDAFFAGPEEECQRQFMEKYNFDPANDKPLPGRYEWVAMGLPS